MSKHKTARQILQGVLHLKSGGHKDKAAVHCVHERHSTENQALQKGNQTYLYFTNLLIGTLEFSSQCKLQTHFPAEAPIAKGGSPIIATRTSSTTLNLRSPDIKSCQVVADNAECNDKFSAKNTKPEKDVKRKVYEPEVSENIGFAVFCMLEDLERLRLYICRAWEKYRPKEINIMNVLVCRNNALEFDRQIENDFSQDWTAVLQYLYPETDWLEDLRNKLKGQIIKPKKFEPLINVAIDSFNNIVREEISKNQTKQWTCEMERLVKFCK